ncbi:Uncharacterised protein [Vibrio cholerae]|nr:Uncharacterised protein [Vibrio cholerae]
MDFHRFLGVHKNFVAVYWVAEMHAFFGDLTDIA